MPILDAKKLKKLLRLHSLTIIQRQYYADFKHRFQWVGSGRRSRKTLIACKKMWLHALNPKNANKRYFHGAPTIAQAKGIFWDRMLKWYGPWIANVNRSELAITLKNGVELHVEGLDRPERIEGQPWHGCHITEIGNVKLGAWDANIRPVLADTKGWAILDGVPEPGNLWYRDMAKAAAGGTLPVVEPDVGGYGESSDGESCFYTWWSSDVLDDDELEQIKLTTDPRTYRIEFQGSFEQLAGLVYDGFTSDYYPNGNIDTTVEYDSNLPVYLGFDFNVDPMTAVLFQVKTASSGKASGRQELHVFKAYHIRNYNTTKMSNKIIEDWPDVRHWIITTCQSGENRQTSQQEGLTDRRIIRTIFSDCGCSYEFKQRAKNPPVRHKVNAVNAKLSHNLIRINPRKCRDLISDWESLTWKEGTSDIDTKDKMRGHLADAIAYPIERHWPIRVASNANLYNKYSL